MNTKINTTSIEYRNAYNEYLEGETNPTQVERDFANRWARKQTNQIV